jgi:hypothetical protein
MHDLLLPLLDRLGDAEDLRAVLLALHASSARGWRSARPPASRDATGNGCL